MTAFKSILFGFIFTFLAIGVLPFIALLTLSENDAVPKDLFMIGKIIEEKQKR